MMKRSAAILLILASILSLAACAPVERTARGFSMGSDYYVTYYGRDDLDQEIQDILSSIEESFSVRVQGSLLDRINSADSKNILALSVDESAVLSRAFKIAKVSENAFDPAILPLVTLWGFDPPYDMNGMIPPSEESIQLAKNLSSLDYFEFDEEGHTIKKDRDDARLDLGAAIKGYAVEKVAEFLKKQNVSESLVYLGGTIAAVGREYEIGVTPPRDSEESYAFRFTLESGEICATSGDYERYYIYNGTRYHHILDATTGRPSDSGIISATVISSDGMLADALATAVVVLGEEKGIALLEKCGARGILVDGNKRVIPVGVTVTVKDQSYEIK